MKSSASTRIWPSSGGNAPEWPKATGRRIFAYLKPDPSILSLLTAVNQLRLPVLVYADRIDIDSLKSFSSETCQIVDKPLNMARTAMDCHLAILNGNHATTADVLLAGKPILQLPLTLEQWLLSDRIAEMGTATTILGEPASGYSAIIQTMLNEDRFTQAARMFALRYAAFDPQGAIEQLVDRVEEMVRR